MIALGTVEFEREFAGQVNPDWHFLFLAWGGIGLGQAFDDLPPDEMTEQIGLGSFRDVLQIIDVALAQSFQHEGTIVLKRDQVHYFFRRRQAGLGGGRSKAVSRRSRWARMRW
jgi:hypothetical protein